MEPDTRDEVIDFIGKWLLKTVLTLAFLLARIRLSTGKYYEWSRRYGRDNDHNAAVPRDHWLEPWEKQAIIGYFLKHPDLGYRRLTYMMMDEGVVAVSPATTYNVLREAGLMGRRPGTPTRKGQGFTQPLEPHQHWHVDLAYLNIAGTFYYLCTVLDGYSRTVVTTRSASR